MARIETVMAILTTVVICLSIYFFEIVDSSMAEQLRKQSKNVAPPSFSTAKAINNKGNKSSPSAQSYFAKLIKKKKPNERKSEVFKMPKKQWPVKETLKQRKRSKFFDSLFKNYDKRLLPSNTTVQVESAIFLNSLDSISEISFSYDMGMFLRLKWNDPRLRFNVSDADGEQSLNIDALMYDQLWVPDLFIVNEKKASFHFHVTPNRLIKLSSDGTILFSSRYYFTVFCQMQLQAFPFDSQFCHYQIQSYAYPQNKMNLYWAATPLEVTPNLLIAQFSLNSIDFESTIAATTRGNFSCLFVTFHFIRHLGFYIIQIYVPSFLTVLTAFTSFWIDPLAVPARVTVGVFTTLIMANMSFSFRTTLPTVSYIKAIDIWILACTLFVFTALVEYAFVNVLVRQKPSSSGDSYTLRMSTTSSTRMSTTTDQPPTPQTPMTPTTPRLHHHGVSAEDSENIRKVEVRRKPVPLVRSRNAVPGDIKLEEMANQIFLLQMRRHNFGYRLLRCLLPGTDGVHFHDLTGLERCDFLEALCRRMFPFCFGMFNVCYWIAYLHFMGFVEAHDDAGIELDHSDRSRHKIELQ